VLYERYASRGFEILAFPCNQFGGQEPGTNAEIQAFAKARGATYPVFGKIDVNGAEADPVYKWLKSQASEALGDGIKWNFAKFLLNGEGKVVKRYGPPASPLSFEADIVALLD